MNLHTSAAGFESVKMSDADARAVPAAPALQLVEMEEAYLKDNPGAQVQRVA